MVGNGGHLVVSIVRTDVFPVWDLLQEMQQATMEYMRENLPHPPRRKRLTKKHLGLN